MFDNFVYLVAWVILPIILEFIPAVYNFIYLLKKKTKVIKNKSLKYFPDITIIIPVYNSSKTLAGCIQSVNDSNYDNNAIEIILIDNGSKDNSFKIFQECQLQYPNLSMNWMTSKQGKSKALNKAIFNSKGKYIINIDSDGKLEQSALLNMVYKFEFEQNVDCVTGTILIEPALIEETKKFPLKIFRRLEFLEYCQAFLATRNYESNTDNIFTLSGAFSAFRKSTILKTQLYNTNTICEDTHLTYQVKKILKQQVYLCEDALFFVDPIDDFDKFYTQRQRWQIGELEVNHMFIDKVIDKNIFRILSSREARLLVLDHTYSFPKLIWYFALIAICWINYSLSKLFLFTAVIYSLYVVALFLYAINIFLFLDKFSEIQKYYKKMCKYLVIMPIYSLIGFFIRLIGIINSIYKKSSWKTNTLSEEQKMIKDTFKNDFKIFYKIRKGLRKLLEKE